MKYSYAVLLIVMLIFFGYATHGVMQAVDAIHNRIHTINIAVQGK